MKKQLDENLDSLPILSALPALSDKKD